MLMEIDIYYIQYVKHFDFHKFLETTFVPGTQLWTGECKSIHCVAAAAHQGLQQFWGQHKQSNKEKPEITNDPDSWWKGCFLQRSRTCMRQVRWLGGWTLISCKQTDCSYSPALPSYQRELCHNFNNLRGLNFPTLLHTNHFRTSIHSWYLLVL